MSSAFILIAEGIFNFTSPSQFIHFSVDGSCFFFSFFPSFFPVLVTNDAGLAMLGVMADTRMPACPQGTQASGEAAWKSPLSPTLT